MTPHSHPCLGLPSLPRLLLCLLQAHVRLRYLLANTTCKYISAETLRVGIITSVSWQHLAFSRHRVSRGPKWPTTFVSERGLASARVRTLARALGEEPAVSQEWHVRHEESKWAFELLATVRGFKKENRLLRPTMLMHLCTHKCIIHP